MVSLKLRLFDRGVAVSFGWASVSAAFFAKDRKAAIASLASDSERQSFVSFGVFVLAKKLAREKNLCSGSPHMRSVFVHLTGKNLHD